MSAVIAALDADAAAGPVLSTALALASVIEASVIALHVCENGTSLPEQLTSAAGVELRQSTGSPIELIVSATQHPDVAALVLGARAMEGGAQPAGHTTLEVITRATTPVAIVPPQARPREQLARILVPLDGTSQSARALDDLLALAHARRLEVLVLHVYSPATVPKFSDHVPHATHAREREFLLSNISTPHDRVKLLHRLGVPADDVVAAARETDADLIALAWSQSFKGGSARVVSETLAHSDIPVLLLPVS